MGYAFFKKERRKNMNGMNEIFEAVANLAVIVVIIAAVII